MKQVGHSNGKRKTLGDSRWGCSDSFWFFGGVRGPKELQKGPRDQLAWCEDAPMMHRGCTKEAPSKQLGIDMGPGALKKRTIKQDLTVD